MSLNWATLDPKNRIYKGKNLYKWEVSPGLEHHCGTCATPLHNPRVKTSCIGIHVEPCYRFHQQLHFVGKSHECFGCNKSDEMHHNRHKDILKQIRIIAGLDSSFSDEHRSFSGGLLTTSNRKPVQGSSAISDTTSEATIEDGKHLTRSERKKAKKAGMNGSKRKNMEVFPQEDLDFVSEAIHRTILESKGAWQGTYDYDKTVRKPDEVEDPVMANVSEDLNNDMSLTPVKDAYELTPRQRKILKRTNTPVRHNNYSGGSRKYMRKRESAPDLFDGIDPEVFFRLGVEVVDPLKNSVTRKDLIVKLVAAVKDDLAVIAQEAMEAEIREAGFWRWAGKSAWHNIRAVRETIDWATGQKIDPLAHRPAYDMDTTPVFDDEDFENEPPIPILDELAVKSPTANKQSMFSEDCGGMHSQEVPSSLPMISEEANMNEDFQVVTKKSKVKKKHTAELPRTPVPTKNLAARKSLFKKQQRPAGKSEEDDVDFTPEAMASKICPGAGGGKADTLEYPNVIYRGSKRQIIAPRR